MATRIIAIANQKGGVGKTTTTHNITTHLAIRGYSVLAIDLSPQRGGLTKLSQVHVDQTIADVLGGAHAPTATLRTVAQTTAFGYDIAPSNMGLANVAAGLAQRAPSAFGCEHLIALRSAIQEEGHRWDYVLIDTAADPTGVLTFNALVAADTVIAPTQAERLSLHDLGETLQLLDRIDTAFGPKRTLHIIATMVDLRLLDHQAHIDALGKYNPLVIPARRGQTADEEIFRAYAPIADTLEATQ